MLEIIRLEISDSLITSRNTTQIFKAFVQGMLNRICVGEQRYGVPKKAKRYHTRMKKEMVAYQETGNAEHLINIANYCILEWIAPEHPRHHFDPTVDSVTRNALQKPKD